MNKPRGTNQVSALNQGILSTKLSRPESPPLPPVSSEGKAKVDMLLVQVDALPESEDSSLIHRQLNALREACILACSDAETLRYAVERLHRACLKSRTMCSKVAILSNAVSSLEVEGERYRNVLLNCLQVDYESRQQMQTDFPEKFLNAAALLCEIFTKVRSQNTPITVLSEPVLEYLETLLSGDEQEIELFAALVVLTGNDLKNVAYLNFQKLLLKVRDTLKSRNLSSQCRLWLLLIMDISNRYYDTALSDIDKFYMEHLGPASQNLLDTAKTIQHTSTDDSKLLARNESDGSIVTEKVSQMSVSNNISKQDEKSFKRSQGVTVLKGNETDKRENFRAAFHVNSNADKNNRKYWLHDDRFEKDEGVYNKPTPNIDRSTASPSNWKHHPGNKSGKETASYRTSKETSSSKNFNDDKGSWRKSPSSATNSASNQISASVDWQENWDE